MLLNVKKKLISFSSSQKSLISLVNINQNLKNKCVILKKTKNIVLNTNSYSNYFEGDEENKSKTLRNTSENNKETSTDKSYLPTLSTDKILKKKISRNISTGINKKNIPLNQTFTHFKKKFEDIKTFRVNYINPHLVNSIENITKIIFSENEYYYYLKYDEHQIFSNFNNSLKKKNYKLIYEKINYLKQNDITNFSDSLYKLYKSKENNFSIKLKSIEIKFENITKKENPKIFILPLIYIPLFYYQNFYAFKYILLSMFSFKDNFNKIEFNEKELKNFLKISSLFIKDFSISNVDFLKKSVIEDKNIEEQKKLKGNIYTLIWNTPIHIYKVTIELPKILIVFNNLQNVFHHFIEKDLILYLLNNNFLSWDFYVIKYLISFKKFRILFENNHTKQNLFKNKETNSNYLISPKVKSYIDKLNKNKSFLFINSDKENKNSIYIIHPLKMELTEEIKDKIFTFTLNQMEILSHISLYENLNDFLQKLLCLNTETQKYFLNYDFFQNLNKKEFFSILSNNLIKKRREPFHRKTNRNSTKSLFSIYQNTNNTIKEYKKLTGRNFTIFKESPKKLNINEKVNFTLQNPIIEKIEIIQNEIVSNYNKDEIYEIKIENFKILFDCEKEFLPQKLFKNYHIIEKKVIDNENYINKTVKPRKSFMKKSFTRTSIKNIRYSEEIEKINLKMKDKLTPREIKQFDLSIDKE